MDNPSGNNLRSLAPLSVLALLAMVPAWSQTSPVLTVKSATNKRVELTWTGAAATYTVQRTSLGNSFSTLATASKRADELPSGDGRGVIPLKDRDLALGRNER